MCQCKMCLFSAFLCLCVYTVTAFNVDSFNYAFYETPFAGGRNSMFGFSVALHRERDNGWLIVGAPEAQTYQPGVIRGGAVYKCPTDRDGGCEEVPFDTKGHNRDARNNLMDNKTEQWFGATVSSSGKEEGPIVACAPRYTWFPNGRSRRDPVGTCYVCNGFFGDFNEYSPCRTYQWGYHRQGSCQAGFSAAINKVGDRLFIGSPGSWYWQGQMYSIDAHAKFDFKPPLFSATYGHEGQVHQQSLETRPAVFSTTEGTENDDDSYMGYSTITGDFMGNGEEGIAVGKPRGNYLKGEVLLFTWNLTNYQHHFTSDQIGSYYGYALAACDIDSDGKLDLIVGAPMYTVQNNKDKYDVGRVYVIYQGKNGKFDTNYIIDGFNSKSRFGQALASLGDINQDGYGDFAVGAPYDGKDNRGAVYVYHGSSTGVRKKFSQVIFAEDIDPLPTGSLATFGFSITGGLDLDGNLYPDMAVGAYLSNKAYFFRSRPVIKVEASVNFSSDSVDIVNTDHVLRDGSAATKTQVRFCSRYYGEGIPSSLKLGVEYSLDTKKLINPRMGFVHDEGQNRKNSTITLYRDKSIECAPAVDVYVRSDIRDKLTALVVEAKYWLLEDGDLAPLDLQIMPRNPRATLIPVLDLNSPPSKKDSISIQKNCGSDNKCIPNLDVTVEPSVQQYYLVKDNDFFLDIIVSNSGEDAFEATVEVKYPDGFFFVSISDIQVVSHVLCNSENNTLKCDIGNPIPFNSVSHFKVTFRPNYDKDWPSKLYFDVSVNSTNEEPIETRHNNKKRVEISILYDVIQEIRGWSIPSEVLFSPASSLYAEDISNQTSFTASKDRLSEEVIGPQVIHVYELKNGGKTKINAAEIFFVWPATTATGEDFLYLVDPPHFSFTENLNLKCGPIPANYRDFELITRRKSIWELYDINVLGDSSSEKITSNKDGSHKIGSTVGGKIVEGDETLNKEVDTSADSSKVLDARHQNKTTETVTWRESTRVQIVEAGEDILGKLESGSFKHLPIGGKNYIYRCFRTINGRESEVNCGSDFSFTQNMPQLLQVANAQYQEEGDLQYWCLEQDNVGNWKKVTCHGVPKVPVTVEREGKTTVQIFRGSQNQIESGKYQQQIINGDSFIYRCFRRRNGHEEEIDCGKNFSFSSVDLPWVLEQSGIQQEGNIRYACLKPDSEGRLQRTNCQNVPKIHIKTEIHHTSWGSNNTHYWNDTGVYYTGPKLQFSRVQVLQGNDNIRQQLEGGFYRHQFLDGNEFIYRCFRSINGREQETDCGENFSLARFNIAGLLERNGVQQDARVRYTCLEPDNSGGLKYVQCGNIPIVRFKTEVIKTFWKSNGTHYWNNTGVYTIHQTYNFDAVQVLQGGSEIISQLSGQYNLENVEGQEFLYRCFKNTQQITCDPNFSLAGINIIVLIRRVALQREGNIRYCCIETDSTGNWRGADCSRLPKIQVVLQKQSYETQQQILRMCYKLVNGQWNEADCTSDVRFQTGGGGGDGSFAQRCYQTIDGRREPIDCNQIPAGATFTDLYSQSHYNQQSGGSSTSETSNYNQRYGQNTHQQSSVQHNRNYGGERNYNEAYGGGTHRSNYSQSYDGNYEYEDEYDEDDTTISSYVNPQTVAREEQQGRRDPKTYGQYSGSRNQAIANSGVNGVAQGNGFTVGLLDLGSLGQAHNSGNSQRTGEVHWSETHQVPPVHNNIGDNVPTASPSSKNWHHGRRKREIVGDNHPSIAKIKEKYPCKNLECVYMRCTIENLQHGKPLTVALRGRLNAKVLRNMKLDNAMQFSSMMLARVQKVPHLVDIEDSKIAVQEIETVVKTPEEIKSETVPLWVVVLSAVAGTIILLLLIFLLYKLGFFKRNRPSSAPERQPLNRNGYHHGDEAL